MNPLRPFFRGRDEKVEPADAVCVEDGHSRAEACPGAADHGQRAGEVVGLRPAVALGEVDLESASA
jgi:hypothetical protein